MTGEQANPNGPRRLVFNAADAAKLYEESKPKLGKAAQKMVEYLLKQVEEAASRHVRSVEMPLRNYMGKYTFEDLDEAARHMHSSLGFRVDMRADSDDNHHLQSIGY